MDDYICMNGDSNSSHSSYSDKIDSDVEAELYSVIHHQESYSDKDSLPQQVSENEKTGNVANFNCSFNQISPQKNVNADFRFNFQPVTSNELDFKEDMSVVKNNVNFTNSPKKQKSCSRQSSDSIVILSDDSEQNIKSLKHKPHKRIHGSSSGNIGVLQEKCIVLDSSDSNDSIMWTENDNGNNFNLQTNLLNDVDVDTISLSSDSSDYMQFVSPKKSFNCVSSALKKKQSSEDLWYIDEEDRSRRRSKIYREISCSNCYGKGHVARFCNVKKILKCFFCGGDHPASQCEKRMCSKCYNMGHDSRFCWMQFVSNCDLCNMLGHKRKDCPDHWRRYHLTTNTVKIVPGKPINQIHTIYCFNCGLAGHIGSLCKEPRTPGSSMVTWPCVISYSNTDISVKCINSQRSPKFADLKNNIAGYKFPKCIQDFITDRKNKQQDFIAVKRKKPKIWEIYKQRATERKMARLSEQGKDFPRTPTKYRREKSNNSMAEGIELELNCQQYMRKRQRRRRNKKKMTGANS